MSSTWNDKIFVSAKKCLCIWLKPSKHSSRWRRLDEDEYIRLSLTTSEDLFKTSSRPLGHYSSWPYVSSRHLQDVFKTFSRRFQDVLQRYLQGVFKKYHQVKLFLLARLREVFNTFLRCYFPKTIIHRDICLGNTTFEKFLISFQNLQGR